jgi:ATP-dependent Clp protease adaptor protein ClpS
MAKLTTQTGTPEVAVEAERKTQTPPPYRVLLHNDDYTTMEFVVMVLILIFHHSEVEAVKIMLHVHKQGMGVAGVFSREVAETRVEQVTRLARAHEFPLKCTMEPA